MVCITISSLTPKLIQQTNSFFQEVKRFQLGLVATVQTRGLGCELAIVGRELGHKLVHYGLFLWSYLDHVGIFLYIVCCFVSSKTHECLEYLIKHNDKDKQGYTKLLSIFFFSLLLLLTKPQLTYKTHYIATSRIYNTHLFSYSFTNNLYII